MLLRRAMVYKMVHEIGTGSKGGVVHHSPWHQKDTEWSELQLTPYQCQSETRTTGRQKTFVLC